MDFPVTIGSDKSKPAVLLSFFALSLGYLAGVLAIFSPYRFFPTDDLFL